MWQVILPIPLLSAAVALPDLTGIGESAAAIGDPQTVALYFSMAFNFLLVMLWQFANFSNRKTADRFADAAKISAEADLAAANVGRDEWAQMTAQNALLQQELSNIKTCLRLLPDEVGDAVAAAMKGGNQ